ncbi:MAG: MMPL family transporter [Desulfosarcinaceae bacterium]|nr:MMPL family transporter [Desulfosarcinaceae bacterium]
MAFHRLTTSVWRQHLAPSNFLNRVLDRPKSFLLALLLLTVALGAFLPRLSFKTSVHDLVVETLPDAQIYNQFRDRFGSEELIRVVIRADDLFTPTSFAALTHLSTAAEKIPGVARVISLPVVKATVDLSGGWTLQRFRQLVDGVPLFDRNLVSADGRTTALTLVLGNDAAYGEVIAAVDALIADAEQGLTLYQIGMPLVSEALGALTQSDFLFLPPITALIVALVLYLVLPLKRLVFLPILCVGLALVWSFGLMGLWGLPLSLLTLIVPVFLIAVGTAYCLHILSAFCHQLAHHETVLTALHETYAEMAPPTVLAVATTVFGLTSLLLNRITAIQEFALFAVMGMFALLVMILILLPAALILMPMPAPSALNARPGQRLMDRITAVVVRLNSDSRRPVHLLALAMLVVVCLLGMLRLRVETSPVAYFQEDTEIATHFRDIYQQLSGSFPANVVVGSPETDFFEQPQNLKLIETLQTFLDDLPGVDKTISFVDYLKLVNYASNRYDHQHYRLPSEPFEIRILINSYRSMLGKEMMTPFMTNDFSRANILLMTRFKRSGEFLDLRKEVLQHARAAYSRDLTWTVTGLGLTLSASSQALTTGQIKSLCVTLLLVFVILALLCLSIKVALISLLPNLFPIVVTFGTMGWLGIELSMVTSLIASVAIGLAVDDTIHYLVRYNREIKKDLDKERAMAATLSHLVRPVVFTSVTIGLGFSVLTVSNFIPTSVFGLMMILTLCSALVGDLVILPTLLQRTELATLWDLIQIKLGRDPGNAIPLFENLSRLQMNFAFMAGVLRKLAPGETLFVQGASEKAMYVVISGELDVIVDSCRQGSAAPYTISKTVNHVGCGGVVGEMGLFRDAGHMATVTATAPTEVLQINQQMLNRLELLHPRAARRLMQNLVRILCNKLEDMTANLTMECVRDDVTGLYNPNGFREILTNAVCRARRYNELLTLCLIQVHQHTSVANSVEVANHRGLCHRLAKGLRCSDTLAPIQNGTFALLLPRTAARKADVVGVRLQAMIEAFYREGPAELSHLHLVTTHLDDPKVRSGGDLLDEAFQKLAALQAQPREAIA